MTGSFPRGELSLAMAAQIIGVRERNSVWTWQKQGKLPRPLTWEAVHAFAEARRRRQPSLYQRRRDRRQAIIDQQLLTGAEAAHLLQITRTTLYSYVRRGLLECPFRRKAVEQFAAQRAGLVRPAGRPRKDSR